MATQSQKQQEIAKKLANLTPEKRSAFIKLLKKEGIDPTKLPIIPTNRESKPTPLSWGQERLWFLDQFEENSTTYNLLLGVTINGTLDIGTLQKSLDTIIERHEVLRTNFQEIDGHAVQIIKPAATWPLTIENCPESEITKYIHQEQQKPFNLATDILVRATLLKISHSKYILLITRHHIVWDGWSTGIFLQELSTIYQSYIQGKNPNLTPLTIQYADFSQWQREWLTEEILAEQIKYWQENLKNAPSLLQLPTDKPRPSIMTFNGKNQQLIINQEIAEKLQLLSRETGTTLFMTLLAVFSTLLYRYSNQEDILIGSPIANRNKAEIEPLIGFFVNTLVLRTLFSENLTFTELLQQIKQTTLSAYNHQDVPFEQIVDAVKVERSLSHSPLFQVMFVLQNTPSETIKLPDATLTPLTLEKETTNFDLTLDIEPSEQGLVANWEYNSDLFEDATITRMLGHFENILTSVLANPQQQVNQINLLTAAERNQLLLKWNDTKVDYHQNKCIHQLFEEQVNKTPDAIAVIFENQKLTYQELNQKANQLAHYLQQLGVKPETLVGICVERSLEMVIGLLGILKAGGAYVPIDPNYPSERIGYTISDSGVAILLTQTSLVTSLPKHQAEVICLDKDWEKIIKESKINPINIAKSENLAYVIYTSGSTGKPKGVLVNHANVMRLFTATEAWYNFNSTDVWTMFHSYAFDFSVWEIWGALIYGGRLVIVPYLISREPAAFYQLLSQEKVTILNQTPSAFRQLIQTEETQINNGKLTNELNLRFVIFGGEALELQSLKPWFDRHSDSSPKLVNMYGITETTVHVTYRPLTIADLNSNASVIGCPIPDLQVYLLDQYQQPVPIGVAGEMYVGGAGVTRGYLKRPKLNDQRFIADSFSNKKDARLYKSGDLARYLSNGDLQYLGRIDNQVKIRGFRIELGEIEAALTQYPDIRETIVITTENTSSDKQLVAYIVPQTEIQPSISDLRNFLKEQLPDYMIPSIFVTLDALPLTSNGKIDRRALPKPEINRG
jgi:amino acid adenylation domain-containing protein